MKSTRFFKGLTLLSIFIFLMTFVSASNANYTETGTELQNYNIGSGQFNAQLSEYDTYTKTITSPNYIPYTSDLDGDGTTEIIVFDGNSMRLFRGEALTIVDSFTLDATKYSPPMIRDFDSDGIMEIAIYYPDSYNVTFYSYNGTATIKEKSLHTVSKYTSFPYAHTSFIGCYDDSHCSVMWDGRSSNTRYNYIALFNYTIMGNTVAFLEAGNNDKGDCFPYIPNMVTADADTDGLPEYYMTTFYVDDELTGSQEYARLWKCEENSGMNNATCTKIYETTGGALCTNTCGSTWTCEQTGTLITDSEAPSYITSPVLLDFDDSVSNGDEIVFGYKTAEANMRMVAVSTSGTERFAYPGFGTTVFTKHMSNPIIMNAFDDTSSTDVCIVNYYNTGGYQDITCVSARTNKYFFTGGTQYTLLDYPTNITPDYNTWSTIAHASQHNSTPISGNNRDEVLNTFGMISFNGDESSITGIGHGSVDWYNPVVPSAGYSVDVGGVAVSDILMLSATNLWYYDDRLLNNGCSSQNCIREYYVNPCVDSVWKNSTNLEIRIKVIDDNGYYLPSDMVTARAILYYGQSNQQDTGWSANATSGTTFTFNNLKINQTITGAILRLEARETGVYSEVESIELPFSVGTQGVQYGECYTRVDIDAVEDDDATAPTEGNNSIDTAINYIDDYTGLGSTIIWLLLCAIVVGFIMYQISNINNPTPGIIIAITGIASAVLMLMLWIGLKLEYIGSGVFISFIILGIVVAGLMVSRVLHGGG